MDSQLQNSEEQYVVVPDYGQGMGGLPMGMGGVPMPQRSDRADLIDKVKPELPIKNLRHLLMGQELQSDGTWKDVPALSHLRISEEGAWEITNLMLSSSTINVSMSNFKDHEIRKRVYNIVKSALRLCISHYKRYNIRDQAQMYFVKEVVFTNTWSVLKQAEGAGTRNFFGTSIQENRLYQNQPKETLGQRVKRGIGLGG